ncbi:MAG TPA: squalene/phytoene synthase family protein [Allosphingosinicella sp.]|nr:squalene/phytoene synthase family protein [Allosphingosinicella sp.]
MTSDLDPDRILALSYVSAARRPALEALWRLDASLGAVLAGGREPMISRIKLAWWREALERLDGERAPAEPMLQALAGHVLPAGFAGAELAEMVEGWEILLSPEPLTGAELALYAEARGARLFRLSARLLGGEPHPGAGERWALVDLARHSNETDADAAIAAASAQPRPARWPARLRPLGMLAALAARDADPARPRWERQGAPGRMLRMLRVRLTGR